MNNNEIRGLLEEFIDWARECGEDAFYVFEEDSQAIEYFLKQRNNELES